jgi:transcriptional regulator with XRE-family HTH domain
MMDAVRTYIEKKGITQADLAARVGVKQPTLNGYLSGKYSPSVRVLKRLSKETGISVTRLLEGTKA